MKRVLIVTLLILSMLISACQTTSQHNPNSSQNFDSSYSSTVDSNFNSSIPDSSFDSSIFDSSFDSSIFDSSVNSNSSVNDKPTHDCAVLGHVDDDANEICDACYESVVVTVDFYVVNDLHGKFVDTSKNEGVGSLTTYIENQRANDEYSVLLSSGDMWQGASESNLTNGLILTDWMNQVGFSSMTLGNHEYDWGEDAIRQNAELANFPILALNVFDRATNNLVDYCQPSTLVDYGEVQIGIIGAMGDVYSSISSEHVKDIYFKTGSELTTLVKAESQKLKQQGADIIVYSLHDGYGSNKSSVTNVSASSLSYYGEELSKGGYVDIVFEGHTHKYYVLKDNYGVYHLQGGGDHSGFCHAEIAINTVTGEKKTTTAEQIRNSVYSGLKDHKIVSELLEKYADQVDVGKEVLGYNSAYRSSNELCQKIADLYFELGVKHWGDKYDVVLGGGSFNARSPYNISAGDVTYSMLLGIFPFDNYIVLCKIQGKYLKSRFINGSYYVAYKNGLSSQTVKDNEYYYIITDSWSSLYEPNHITEVEKYTDGVFARDLLAEYIRQGGFAK